MRWMDGWMVKEQNLLHVSSCRDIVIDLVVELKLLATSVDTEHEYILTWMIIINVYGSLSYP